MAKSFSSLKQGLGLLDILQIGKYKGCRVDSIIDQDDGYLRFMQSEKILVFDKSVMDALMTKFSLSIPVKKEYYPDSFDQINRFQEEFINSRNDDSWDDDIPF